MIIVIDAYNVLKLSHEATNESERRAFIADIRRYGKKKGHSMVVVFDGGPYQWPFRSVEKNVLVIYSGVNDTADDCIKKYLSTIASNKSLLVSSDRQLCLWASDHDILSIGSSDFLTIMHNVIGKKYKNRIKPIGDVVKVAESDKEIDALMEEASAMVDAYKEEDDAFEDRPQKKLKKSERKAWDIIKKLQ